MANRYELLTGKNLSEEKYLATWELDNNFFDERDRISKKDALDWFKDSNRSTIVIWDNKKDCLVGYLTPYLVTDKFACDYIASGLHFKSALNKNTIIAPRAKVNADIYIFSTIVDKEYRDKPLVGAEAGSVFYKKPAFKVLNEALVDWICSVKEKGVSINYIFGERTSDDGEKYFRSLGMQPCFINSNDCKFAKLFTPQMFEKCTNVNKLYELYSNEKMRVPFDTHILDGHEYLSIKDNVLYYKDINLLELVKKYKAPLEVGYTPMIEEKINYLKKLFADKIKKYGYPNKYAYAYATKANYYSEVVLTALNHIDMLETSSAYDIDIIERLARKGFIKKGYIVLCNGFKNEKYIKTLKNLLDLGIDVRPIIENRQELELLSRLSDYKINVGLRYNSDFESRLIKNTFNRDEEFDNRFGFNAEEMDDMAELIGKTQNLTLKIVHFHFGGSLGNINNYIKGFANIISLYCQLKKQYDSLECFDFGGGFPTKYSLTYSFDYDELVDKIVKTALEVCKINKVACPILIGEHGRFTTADHGFYIFKVDFTKQTYDKNWYIINGSIMNMTPDVWGIQQDFTILPVNLYQNKCIPVCLGGETCDPDDRYFIQNENIKLFMPEVNKGETLYIAIFSIGAYQEIISGVGGLHHCLIPEGNELVITEKDGKREYITTGKLTDSKKMFDILDYDDISFMNKFYRKK